MEAGQAVEQQVAELHDRLDRVNRRLEGAEHALRLLTEQQPNPVSVGEQ